MPVVAMKHVGIKINQRQHLQHAAGEKGEALAVIIGAVNFRAIEVKFIVEQVIGHALHLRFKNAAVLACLLYTSRCV